MTWNPMDDIPRRRPLSDDEVIDLATRIVDPGDAPPHGTSRTLRELAVRLHGVLKRYGTREQPLNDANGLYRLLELARSSSEPTVAESAAILAEFDPETLFEALLIVRRNSGAAN